MNPYLQFAIGAALAVLIMVLGWVFVNRNRREDKESGSEKEGKDADRAATARLAAQLEAERAATARNVETGRVAETARVEADRKEVAGVVDAEQRRLMDRVGILEKQERVGELERKLLTEIGIVNTSIAVLTERVNAVLKRCEDHHT